MNRKRREAKEETGTKMQPAPGATKRVICTQHPRPCTRPRHHQTCTRHWAPPKCHTQRKIRRTKLAHLANELPRSPRDPSTLHLKQVAACSGNGARKEVHDLIEYRQHPKQHHHQHHFGLARTQEKHTCTRHQAPPIMRLVHNTTAHACATKHNRTCTRHPAPPSARSAPATTKVSSTD